MFLLFISENEHQTDEFRPFSQNKNRLLASFYSAGENSVSSVHVELCGQKFVDTPSHLFSCSESLNH